MVCIQCGEKTQVINSRAQKRRNHVWRRRQCANCGTVFTTEEQVDYSGSIVVANKIGTLQPFSRDKLFLSIHRSCQHRPTALADAAGLTDTVITRLTPLLQDGTVDRTQIIRTIQVALTRFDTAASTHYTAFHASS
jgi:transcriptional repressor NrdR